MDLIGKIEKQLEQSALWQYGDRILLGVSGGADSMCLLEAMCELRERYALTLFVVHVHHGIRDQEADGDAGFVQAECERRGVVCRIVWADVPSLAATQGYSLEEAGRRIRYQVFEQVAAEWACERIAVAHNMEDQAETMLFHAFRGSGLRGMAGIPVCREKIIRPLLFVSRAEIEGYLQERGIAWRTDATNLTEDYTRNRIRHRILPAAVKGVNSKSVEHLAELSQELSRVADYLRREAEKWYNQALHSAQEHAELCLSADVLYEVPQVLREQLWFIAFEHLTGKRENLGRVHIEALEDLFLGLPGRSVALPHGVMAERRHAFLYMRIPTGDTEQENDHEETATDVEVKEFPCTFLLPDGELTLSIQPMEDEKKSKIPKNSYTKWFDYDKIGGILTLRKRQQGDFMVIHQDGRTKSLKSLLIDRKIPAAERSGLTLLAVGSRVLWCIGVRAEDGLYVDENTKHILVAELKKRKDEIL